MPNRSLAMIACVLVLACEGQEPFPTEDVARFESALATTHEAQGAVGTAMTVGDGAGRRWVGYAGLADRESGRAVDEHTLIRSASVGKTFTGALILALHEEGALSVDDALSRHVDLVPNGDAITLRMLLQHTSGVPNYTRVAAYREAIAVDPTRVFSYEELVTIAIAEERDFAPGTGWNYSNTGYILLGIVAEQIVGRPIEEELRARFFEPLGMNDTQPMGAEAPAALWTGYIVDGGELREVPRGASYTADGGAWVTSLDDLLTWAHAFFGGRLHRTDTLALAQMPAGGALLEAVAQNFGLETGGYGLGLIVASDATFGALLAGAGNGDGVRTFVGYAPEEALAFAVAVNIGDGSVPIVETLSAAGPLLQAVRDRTAETP